MWLLIISTWFFSTVAGGNIPVHLSHTVCDRLYWSMSMSCTIIFFTLCIIMSLPFLQIQCKNDFITINHHCVTKSMYTSTLHAFCFLKWTMWNLKYYLYSCLESQLNYKRQSKDTVKTKINRRLPTNPPTIVMYSVAASCCLKVCIPANRMSDKVNDSTDDIPLDTAAKYKGSLHGNLSY